MIEVNRQLNTGALFINLSIYLALIFRLKIILFYNQDLTINRAYMSKDPLELTYQFQTIQ